MLNVDRSMIPEDFKYMPTDTEYVYNPLLTCTCHFGAVENPDGTDPDGTNPDGTEPGTTPDPGTTPTP
jgi:hypothetical protein